MAVTSKSTKKALNFAYPKKDNATLISEFEIMNPAREGEVVGEKMVLNSKGEYSLSNGSTINLLFLLDHPAHYRISMVVMNGIQYVIPADREKNWFPRFRQQHDKFHSQ